MAFYFQDDFWESCSTLSDKECDAASAAIVKYYFTKREPTIKGSSLAVFRAFRGRLDIARSKSKAGGTTPESDGNQNAIKPESTPESEANQNAIKPEGALLKGKSKSKKGSKEPPLPPLEQCDEEASAFAVEALAVFNAVTECDVRDMPSDAWCGLRRIFDAGRTINDVRLVVEKKNTEWKGDKKMARFIRPSTLFGGKFDEYLNQKNDGESADGEVGEYSDAW